MKTENEIIDKLDYATLPRIRIFMILGCSFFRFFFGQDFFDESHSAPFQKRYYLGQIHPQHYLDHLFIF